MTTKWIICLRPSFSFIFQEIHQTSPVTRFFQRKKRFKKWWKLRVLSCFEDHSYIEIRLPDGSSKSCKMTPKCITNHREMSMKKHKFRSCNAQKRTPSTDLQNCIKTRSLLSLPVLLCARHACKNRSKSLKFYHKITTKSTNAVVAMVRNARCRSTCDHASKRVDFCCSRCCFAHAMDAKFIQNRRKSSMATCNLSTVVPAARRANSKCIDR